MVLRCMAGALVMVLAAIVPAHGAKPPQACFQSTCVQVDVVSTEEDMMRGLQGRKGLEKNKGMLFVFRNNGIYPFWMKDMLFSIDILWLDSEGRLVDVSAAVPACTADPCPTYAPKGPVRYVLEVPAGFVARHGLKGGDQAAFKNLTAS